MPAMPTIGATSGRPPIEPKYVWSNVNTPPSAAPIHPVAVLQLPPAPVIPTAGAASEIVIACVQPPLAPWRTVSPREVTASTAFSPDTEVRPTYGTGLAGRSTAGGS